MNKHHTKFYKQTKRVISSDKVLIWQNLAFKFFMFYYHETMGWVSNLVGTTYNTGHTAEKSVFWAGIFLIGTVKV